MDSYILYAVTVFFLSLSFLKDKNKTKMSLKKGWKAFENILPEFLVVILSVGTLLAVIDPATISGLIGADSGWTGTFIASLVGSITLIPSFVAFPTAALLLRAGAGYMQIGAFISALMMVGVVTMPVEIRYFGKKMTLYRNLTAFFFSFLVAFVIGRIVG